MKESKAPFKLTIERLQVQADHNVDIFEVTLTDGRGSWTEIMKSEEELRIFLKAIQAASSFFGYFPPPVEVPQNPSTIFVKKENPETPMSGVREHLKMEDDHPAPRED